jgi:hypothetical protein
MVASAFDISDPARQGNLKVCFIQTVCRGVHGSLRAIRFKGHPLYVESRVNAELEYIRTLQGMNDYRLIGEKSREQALLPSQKNEAYLLVKEYFFERFRSADLPFIDGLIALAKISEGLAFYSIEHYLLFSLGLKAFLSLYSFITSKGNALIFLNQLLDTIGSKTFLIR